MLTLQIWNVSDLEPVSDYRYRVLVGDKVIASGKVEQHTRSDGWANLVGKIVDAHKVVMVGKEITNVANLAVHNGGKPRRLKRRAA